MKPWTRYLSLAAVVLSASLWVTLSDYESSKATAQVAVDASQSAIQNDAVKTAAQYLHKSVDYVTPQLRQIGFNPTDFAIDSNAWRGFSTERKIATAFQYAQAAEPQLGGERFLAMLSRQLALQYDAAAEEPALKRFFETEVPFDERVAFKQPERNIVVGELPQQIKEAIVSTSKYVDRNSVSRFIEQHTGLSKSRVFDIVTSSSNTTEMLERAVSSVESGKQRSTVERMIGDIARKYEAASYEKSFKPFLKSDTARATSTKSHRPPRDPELAKSFSPRGDPIAKPRGVAESPAARKYPEIIEQNYREPSSRRFNQMRKDVRGFGGVVLGNEIQATVELQKETLVALTYVPEANGEEKSGHLAFSFAGGKILRFDSVLAEDAYVAHRMVFGKTEGAPVWNAGDGIGIVGIERTFGTYLDYGPETVRELDVAEVVLHPAVVDVDLGNVAIITDATPRNGRSLLYQAVRKKHGEDIAVEIYQLFASRSDSLATNAYMFIDVPLEVFAEGEALAVRRRAEEGMPSIPEGIRRSAFIELRIMSNPYADDPDERYDSEFAAAFYREMPVLANSYHDFHRINRFAVVLSLFRWAKECDATCSSMPDPPTHVRTADAVLTTPSEDLDFEDEVIRAADMEFVTDQRNGGNKALLSRLEMLEDEAKLDTDSLKEVLQLRRKLVDIQNEFENKLEAAIDSIEAERDRQAAYYWLRLKALQDRR